MANDTVLNIKISKTLKQQAKLVAQAVDLPLSTVVTASLRQFVRTRSITIADIPRLKPGVEAELLLIETDMKKRTDLSPKFTDIDEAIAWLDGSA